MGFGIHFFHGQCVDETLQGLLPQMSMIIPSNELPAIRMVFITVFNPCNSGVLGIEKRIDLIPKIRLHVFAPNRNIIAILTQKTALSRKRNE